MNSLIQRFILGIAGDDFHMQQFQPLLRHLGQEQEVCKTYRP